MTCSVVNTLTNACAADAPLLKAVKSREPRCSSANSEIPASAQVKAALCKRFGITSVSAYGLVQSCVNREHKARDRLVLDVVPQWTVAIMQKSSGIGTSPKEAFSCRVKLRSGSSKEFKRSVVAALGRFTSSNKTQSPPQAARSCARLLPLPLGRRCARV